MQYGAAGVFALQFVLEAKGFEWVFGEIGWDLRTIRIINIVSFARLIDVGKTFFVFFGKAIGGSFGWCGFEIVEVSGAFLEFFHTVSDVFQNFGCQFDSGFRGDLVLFLSEIDNHFVDSVDTNGRKMISEMRQIAFGVRVQTAVVHFLNKDSFFL